MARFYQCPLAHFLLEAFPVKVISSKHVVLDQKLLSELDLVAAGNEYPENMRVGDLVELERINGGSVDLFFYEIIAVMHPVRRRETWYLVTPKWAIGDIWMSVKRR